MLDEQFEEIFDERRAAVFRAKATRWNEEHWPEAEETARQLILEAVDLLRSGFFRAATVFAAAAVEVMLLELVMKPIFAGLFLGDDWTEEALSLMLRGRWMQKPTRTLVKRMLEAVARIDVKTLHVESYELFDRINSLLEKRNEVVHGGIAVDEDVAALSVATARGMFSQLLPPLRTACGMDGIIGYVTPATP